MIIFKVQESAGEEIGSFNEIYIIYTAVYFLWVMVDPKRLVG